MNYVRLKKFVGAFLIGAFAISIPLNTDAKRMHDPKVEAKSDTRSFAEKDNSDTITELKPLEGVAKNNFRLTEEEAAIIAPEDNYSSSLQSFFYPQINNSVSPIDSVSVSVPQTTSMYDDSIIGTPMATQQQCVKYLLSHNPNPRLNVSAEEIVAYYYEEGMREGIRPDLAFAQALKETGFFRYGGDVVPEQNNYCGLGTTGGGVRGLYFASSQLGVRAHIQHLLAYTSTRIPTTEIVDPRYSLVRQRYGTNILSKWSDLNGRWAIPGYHYGQDIVAMLKDILVQ